MRRVPEHVLREEEMIRVLRGIQNVKEKKPGNPLEDERSKDDEMEIELLAKMLKHLFKSNEEGKGFAKGVLPTLKLIMEATKASKKSDKKLDDKEFIKIFMTEIVKELLKDPKMKPIMDKILKNEKLTKEETNELKLKLDEVVAGVKDVLREAVNREEKENPQQREMLELLKKAGICDDAGNFIMKTDVVMNAFGDTTFSFSDLARTESVEKEEETLGDAIAPSLADQRLNPSPY